MGRMFVISVLTLLAVPAVAQDYDPGMAAHEATSQTQFVTQQSAIDNHLIRQSVRRNNARRGSVSRDAQTCANGDRMRARGMRTPQLAALARACRQAGY